MVVGAENITLSPPYIVAANHRGWAEIFALWEVWPEWIHWMTRDLNFKIPLLKNFCQQVGFLEIFTQRNSFNYGSQFDTMGNRSL